MTLFTLNIFSHAVAASLISSYTKQQSVSSSDYSFFFKDVLTQCLVSCLSQGISVALLNYNAVLSHIFP